MAERKRWRDVRGSMRSGARARVDARVQRTLDGLPMAELRKAAGLTQSELAESMEMSQGNLSKLERQTDMHLSTLRKYVEALGGTLQLSASFADGRTMVINQLSGLAEPPRRGRSAG